MDVRQNTPVWGVQKRYIPLLSGPGKYGFTHTKSPGSAKSNPGQNLISYLSSSLIQTVTVGTGIAPVHPPEVVADSTAGRDFHPAPKTTC